MTEVRQEIHCLAFGFLKASRIRDERQWRVAVSGKFPDNLGGDLTARREADTGIPQGMKAYLIAVSVRQFNSRRRQVLSDKVCRVNPHKHPIAGVRLHTGFQRRQVV